MIKKKSKNKISLTSENNNLRRATSHIKREQGLNYFIKYVLCLDTTMLGEFENENEKQNKKKG